MIHIREEAKDDFDAIYQLTEIAFKTMPYSDGTEQDVINRLRSNDKLTLSLVAESESGDVIGQVTFSPANNSDGTGPWFALGPVATLPEHQGLGVGSELINVGLKQLQDSGALGCILVGNPDFYSRFGFKLAPDNVPEGEPAEYFQLLLFEGGAPNGQFSFAREFYHAD